MFKKMLMIAGMAIALVALAAPASALANWTHSGEPLDENAHITLTGPFSFFAAAVNAGWGSELTATVELGAGTNTATIPVGGITAHNCQGTGALAGTTCTSTFEGLPWTVHAIPGTKTLRITNIKIHNHYYVGTHVSTNLVRTTTLTGNVLAHATSSEELGTVTLSGENTLVNGVMPLTASGDLLATPSGTYGWE